MASCLHGTSSCWLRQHRLPAACRLQAAGCARPSRHLRVAAEACQLAGHRAAGRRVDLAAALKHSSRAHACTKRRVRGMDGQGGWQQDASTAAAENDSRSTTQQECLEPYRPPAVPQRSPHTTLHTPHQSRCTWTPRQSGRPCRGAASRTAGWRSAGGGRQRSRRERTHTRAKPAPLLPSLPHIPSDPAACPPMLRPPGSARASLRPPPSCLGTRPHLARAGAAQRVAQRDGSAIGVDLVHVQAQLVGRVDGLRRRGGEQAGQARQRQQLHTRGLSTDPSRPPAGAQAAPAAPVARVLHAACPPATRMPR